MDPNQTPLKFNDTIDFLRQAAAIETQRWLFRPAALLVGTALGAVFLLPVFLLWVYVLRFMSVL